MTAPSRSYVTTITLRDGRPATVRPLEAGDVDPLTAFFVSLSADTRSRYGPHPFDRPTAESLCASIDNSRIVRFVTVLNDGQPEAEIIGYMILSREIWQGDRDRYGDRLREGECACLAPVIADAYQDQGVGTQMGRHVVASTREMGVKQLILMGGVLAFNERAQHFYEKLGFKRVGEFWTHYGQDRLNYDMVLDLE